MAACMRSLISKTTLSNLVISNKIKLGGVGGQYRLCFRSKVDKVKEAEKEARELSRAVDRSPVILTEDGIMRNSGTTISQFRTADGKPIYPGKHKWFRLQEGATVRAGTAICFQKKLNYHPGLNVGIGKDLTLYAYEDGTVYITWEKVRFNWDVHFVRDFYSDEKDMNIYKPYYHIIAKEQSTKFRLVDRI